MYQSKYRNFLIFWKNSCRTNQTEKKGRLQAGELAVLNFKE